MSAHRAAPGRERSHDLVLQHILNSPDITRPDLATMTGLSRSAVNRLVAELVADGWVEEGEDRARGVGGGSGRPATTLRAAAGGRPVAGIDFGHNHILVAVGDSTGRPIDEVRLRFGVDQNPEQAMDRAAEAVATLRDRHDITSLASVVAGIPGPIDASTGLVRSPTILSEWVGLDPARELSARLGVPVHVENDAFLGAVGESRRGGGFGHPQMLYVKVSHGVGAGLVLNGRPFQGTSGVAGEIGHARLVNRTEICRCGRRGCLEAVIGIDTIAEQVLETHRGLTPEMLDLGMPDDDVTSRLLEDAGRELGTVLAPVCDLINPGALVIGGDLSQVGDGLLRGVRQSLERLTQPAIFEVMEVVPALLQSRSEIVGALELAVARAAA